MELVLLVGGLGGLCALALRYGHDSREGLRSEEHMLSELGFAWHGKPGDRSPVTVRRAAHPLRRRLAVALNLLADWLYPITDHQQPNNGTVRGSLGNV